MLDHHRFEALGLGQALEKTLAGERLSLDDGLRLYQTDDLHALGALAHHARTRLHGQRVHYVVNRHVNPTNICVNDCRFCAFRRDADQAGAYQLTAEEAVDKLLASGPVDEVHVVGGCHPTLGLSYYTDLARRIRKALPHVSLKALTAVEVDHLAKLECLPVEKILTELKLAGVAMLPGGGAEIFAESARRDLCPSKISGARWLEIMGIAHGLGVPSNATMLFGHVETLDHRLEHLDALRCQQDKSGGFVCFIPLPYLPGNNPLGTTAHGPSATDVLRTMAVSRLMLDNIPHIKSYWVMLGVKLAQLCLSYGADDLDGTVVEEKIGHEAGSDSAQALSISQLEEAIRDAGFLPVRRDALFRDRAEIRRG